MLKENKQSFNITVDHKLNKHVTMSASYSHMKDKWMSKGGWVLDPTGVIAIAMILTWLLTACVHKTTMH